MRLSAELQRKINGLLISLSLVAWALLIFRPGGRLEMDICRVLTPTTFWLSFAQLENFNLVWDQLLGWSLMVLAMMCPKLILPIQQLVALSLKRLRILNASLFVLGYLTSWTMAGILILATSLNILRLLPQSYLPALVCLLLAIIWQCSPYKQFFLNQGRQHKIIRAFGYQAAFDSYVYGVRHGLWCVGSGLLLMLFPMLLPTAHIFAMALITFIMLSEHLQNPRPIKWRVDLRLQLLRYLIVRAGKYLTNVKWRTAGDVES
ncbi:copper chaperone [Undibacterium flavidum]|uniref:DUF2182 domain-containing protein n=1 Tax=Undibacterium flavidum TaxID=2762297 RepID=A0ABR6YF09_9BURK|nr:DUF2182 domain-containing protein [Undibacterium flavidum]MBC3875140.1 DUF2182 domain-containing protein [Undibacterium flavidum]